MHSYEFIEHTADIAVDLKASTIEELFICAAEAWSNAMVDDKLSETDESKQLDFKAASLEELLVDFLSEINYLFLTKKWFCSSVKNVSLKQTNDNYNLSVHLAGVNIENSEIDFNEEFKAVTYHQLDIKKEDDQYKTRVVFDI